MDILAQVETSLKNKLPFVAYRKPNNKRVFGLFQKDNSIYYTQNYNENGFIFAPFDDSKKIILLPESKSDLASEKISDKVLIQKTTNNQTNIDHLSITSSKTRHLALVQKGIQEIKKGTLKKVVLSRKEEVILETKNVVTIFRKLLYRYKSAMVYFWYHPKVGMWLGATPETLIKTKNLEFETVSLAGTLPINNNEKVDWNTKELDEQQFVTDYILDKISPLCSFISAEERQTVQAGNLLHLKTKIKGTLLNQQSNLIQLLHPTPAVCGLPRDTSKNFILQNENYDRSFYTGYLGEIKDNEKHLFVNLRCMEITKNKAHLFVGGGITKDSIPENEWLETCAKASVMKYVL